MIKLKYYRQALNLTQEELAEKSGISVRTIQRIEAGILPKGHTLKTLANTFNIEENELLGDSISSDVVNYSMVKWINISSLPFTIIPSLNIIVPLVIMFATKNVHVITKQIISIQIIWTIVTIIIFLFSVILRNQYYLDDYIPIMVLALLMTLNVFIILRNAAEIDRKRKLYIKLKFNII